eukprot:CAMPEP_0182440170 /NCGR_PEP_ID=MMETSP1167-20130531/86890_1 /TAXON_ID=2988 /ORGANISM="Mallomonas Sp, Strain CCMP3275" /LENGTH=198 /DNA_ID=CAMNT_0024634049 /DNA_START=606 /DNA_END=1203 /DNA_ORIENTATION=-
MTLEERKEFLCEVRHQLLALVSSSSGRPISTYDFEEEGEDFILENEADEEMHMEEEDIGEKERETHREEEEDTRSSDYLTFINIGQSLVSSNHERQREDETQHSQSIPIEVTSNNNSQYQNQITTSTSVPSTSISSSSVSSSSFLLPKIRNVFAVVCDNSPNLCRTYPWGTLQIEDERHSDSEDYKDSCLKKVVIFVV